MSKFFLNNQALISSDFDSFKLGVINLMGINKKHEHVFFRNDSCFENPYFEKYIYPNFNNIDIFNIYNFFAKLSPCEVVVDNEVTANEFCKSDKNGFLGIDFSKLDISNHKKICDDDKYSEWNEYYQSNFQKLESKLINIRYTKKFEKDFHALNDNVQNSIIAKFEDALSQNCINLPDGVIVKDVSNSTKCKVFELRVFCPVALRLYFNVSNNIFQLASIELKSNPDQNEDIVKAEKLLVFLSGK